MSEIAGFPADVAPDWTGVHSAVRELHLYWGFHADFCGNEGNVALMQDILPIPFALIRMAFLTSIAMGIGRLLDPAESHVKGKLRANLSLTRLAQIVRPHASESFNSRLATLLGELRTDAEPIVDRWRDKRFAHADKEMVLDEGPEKLPEVDRDVFENVLEKMRVILAEIHAHFNCPDAPMTFHVPVGLADELMRFIRDGAKARASEVASMFP
jgi:hypothetical protein